LVAQGGPAFCRVSHDAYKTCEPHSLRGHR